MRFLKTSICNTILDVLQRKKNNLEFKLFNMSIFHLTCTKQKKRGGEAISIWKAKQNHERHQKPKLLLFYYLLLFLFLYPQVFFWFCYSCSLFISIFPSSIVLQHLSWFYIFLSFAYQCLQIVLFSALRYHFGVQTR